MIDIIGIDSVNVIKERIIMSIKANNADYDVSDSNDFNRIIMTSVAQAVQQEQIRINELALSMFYTHAKGQALDTIAGTYFRGKDNKPINRNGMSDADFKKHLDQVVPAFGVATEQSYTSNALDAHPDLTNVWTTSPKPSHISISYAETGKNKNIPHENIERAIQHSIRLIKAAGDRVSVVRAQPQEYELDIKIKLHYGHDPSLIIKDVEQRVRRYMSSKMYSDMSVNALKVSSVCYAVEHVIDVDVKSTLDKIERKESSYPSLKELKISWSH